MKKRTFSLTASVSVLALAFAVPALAQAQQPQQNPATNTQMSEQAQSGQSQSGIALNQPIAELDTARQNLEASGVGTFPQMKQEAGQALQNLQRAVQKTDARETDPTLQNIRQAQQMLDALGSEKPEIVEALGNVVQQARQLQQQTAAAGEPSGTGQRTAQIAVDQSAPEVNVRQPAPQVSVEQVAPEISVQQRRPEITVDQRRPEVTVNQPRPEVTVNQPKPEVTINQAKPEVSITQAEPNVSVQRQGEPQITVQKSGRPEVTVEDRAGSDPLQTAPSGSETQAAQSEPLNQITRLDRQQVIGKSLFGPNNESFGDVEDVVLAPDGTVDLLLVDVGGFLGIGVRRVAIPLDKVQLEGDRLTTSLTQEEAENLPPYDRN